MAIVSSSLALLLLATLGCVDAYGTVRYFNVSKTHVHRGDSIVLKCGATLSQDELGEFHTLVVHIKKAFSGSQKWLLSVNEQVEIVSQRYHSELHKFDQVTEVTFTILNAIPGDSGIYSCDTSRNSINVTVDVVYEPRSAVLRMDGTVVGRMFPPPATHLIRRGEPVAVKLGQRYQIDCTVRGGNPAPNVTLASDIKPYTEGVEVIKTTVRDVNNRTSEPKHTANATLSWIPTIQNIGIPFNCSSGIEDLRAVWTSFVPVVTDHQPLFGCVDKVGLADGVNDLMVTCRIVSMNDTLTGIKVRVFGENDRNFTIDAGMGEEVTEKIYEADQRYGVKVVPSRSTFSWNVTLTIKNARDVTDLDSHKLEFVAENRYDKTSHTVMVDYSATDPPSDASKMISSVTAMWIVMMLGWIC